MPILQVAGQQTFYAHRRPLSQRTAPVLLIHGAGGTHQHWLYQVRDLPQSLSMAPDLPGHGRSRGTGQGTIAAYGDWLVSFLDAAGLDQTVLVGHSMGGAIALDVALRYPKRVVGLGLIATGARLSVAPALLESLEKDPATAVETIGQWAFGPEAPPEMVRLGKLLIGATPTEVLRRDFLACDAFDVREKLPQITQPTLVVCGTYDRMTPVHFSVYLRDQIAGARLHLVDGAGHMVQIERPEALVRALVAFLDSL